MRARGPSVGSHQGGIRSSMASDQAKIENGYRGALQEEGTTSPGCTLNSMAPP